MIKVYYFTRTGNSEKIAKEIADKKGAEVFKIEDNIKWQGIFGFIRGGYYSVYKKTVPIIFKQDFNIDYEIILVSPIWAGNIPPTTRSFINQVGRQRITLVMNSMDSKLQEREGFKSVVDVTSKDRTMLDEFLSR